MGDCYPLASIQKAEFRAQSEQWEWLQPNWASSAEKRGRWSQCKWICPHETRTPFPAKNMTSQTTAAELSRAKAAARYLTTARGTTSLTGRRRLPTASP